MNIEQGSVTSADGTTIAFERSGSGPVIILVSCALADRTGTTNLARLLSESFTVINYDRRGRGKSSDTGPYSVEREVNDIGALIDATGGPATLFGSSSGAVLALEAASRLGDRVCGLVMYEPPFIVDDSHPPMPEDFSRQVEALVASDRRNDAVKLFFHNGMGIPGFIVSLMRWLMPGWSGMAKVAHTLPYDLAVMSGTQTGKPLPTNRWTCAVSTLVAVGARSEKFFHSGAKAVVEQLPNGQYQSLAGCHHGSVVMSPKLLAKAIGEFLSSLPQSTSPTAELHASGR